MIKKIVQAFVLVTITTHVLAAPAYPAKINNEQAFGQLNDFQNIYQKIHDDILIVDQPLIIARTCEHETIDCTFVPDEAKKNFVDFTKYFRDKITSLRQSGQSRDRINSILQHELNLARQQNTWARFNQVAIIFQDSDTNNAPFETHDILAEIQAIMIGKKTKLFTPAFINGDQNNEFIPDAEDWQNQTKMKAENTDYSTAEKKSIGGLTHNAQKSLHTTASSITATNKVAKNLWDTWFSTTALGSSKCPGLSMTVTNPLTSTDKPLVLQKIDEQILAQFQGKLESYVNENDCSLSSETAKTADANTKESNTRQTKQQQIQQCESLRQQALAVAMKNFKKNQISAKLKREYQSVQYGLDYFESFVETLRGTVIKKGELFKCYLKHVAK